MDPTHNFSTYRTALNSTDKPCIPLLGEHCRTLPRVSQTNGCDLAVHLHDLHAAITQSSDGVNISGTEMINFLKWRRFYSTARDFLHHKPPDMSKHRESGIFAYMQQQLRGIAVGTKVDEGFERQSKKLEEAERKMRDLRLPELHLLGID